MKMVGNLFFALVLVSVNVFAAGIPEVKNTDNITMGRGANGDDKEFIFNIGDGATNPKLLINDTLKIFNFNKGLDVTGAGVFSGNLSGVDGTFTGVLKSEGASYSLGNGTNQDLNINFDMNGTADIPAIKYDSASGELLIKKKVGANFKKVGSGSGGGGGENFNNGFGDDDNANAEDGTANWSNSGGTFAVTTIDPLEGEQSFTYTPSAQNDYVESGVLSFDKDLFRGNACEARVEYIGGDENLSLQVMDANNDILAVQELPAHSIFGQESAFFICPNATDIGGDANKGNIRYRIANLGASAAPLIKFDKAYMGTLRGLVETTLPDSLAVTFDGTGGGATNIQDRNNIVSNIVRNSAGNYTINFVAGIFTEKPTIVASCSEGRMFVRNISTSSVLSICESTSGNGVDVVGMQVEIEKQGADSKQSVQVYKSIPKVSQNVSEFSAFIDSAGVVSNENVDFINGNCALGGTGNFVKTCTYIASLSLENKMNCTAVTTDQSYFSSVPTSTSSLFEVRTVSDGGTLLGQGVYVTCQKADSDFKTGKTQNISLAGIVVNSAAEVAQKQIRSESCKINNNGTSTSDVDSGLCESWVDSSSRTALGRVSLNVSGFSKKPVCVVTMDDNSGNRAWSVQSISNILVNVATTCASSMTSCDSNFYISCQGVK